MDDVTFNSFFRDHVVSDAACVRCAGNAFNSLSRDHGIDDVSDEIKTVQELSTPSLGITRASRPRPLQPRRSTFNSLSRDHGIT
jgi:hypothetical protein